MRQSSTVVTNASAVSNTVGEAVRSAGHRRVLAIDLGTSGPKAAVIDANGSLLSKARASVATTRLPGDGAEQDPRAVWEATLAACRGALAPLGTRQDIVGIGISSQYSSIVPVGRDKAPAMNFVLWSDKRGAPATLRKYSGGELAQDSLFAKACWIRTHGIPPLDSGMDSLSHMRFIRLARPDVYNQTWKFLEPMDYLALRFTGRAAASPCSAFMTLLVDNRTLGSPTYDSRLIRYAGIDADKLPELLQDGTEIGEVVPQVAAELGLPPGVRVWTGLNDTQAGGIGTCAFTGHHAGISIGTSSVMVTHTHRKRTDILNAIVSMPSPVPDTYFVMAENGIAGRALEHFLENLVFSSDGFGDHTLTNRFAALHRAVSNVKPGSGGVIFLPWLDGSLAPAEDGRMRGGFLNMSLGTTREDLGRAVLEGVAMNIRWLRSPTERFTGRRFSHFRFYGGGAESDIWSQIIADVNQIPVVQADDPQYVNCRGIGLLTLHRAGELALEDFERLLPIKAVYEPRAEVAGLYDTLFEQFIRAFRANRRIFHALNRS